MSYIIIVPTSGRPKKLQRCLQSIIDNSIDPRVAVIDNNEDLGFSQESKAVVESFAKVEYIKCDSPGLTAARHMAVQEFDSEILIFVDDDVSVAPGWLDSILQTFENSNVALAGGPSLPDFEGSVPAWFWDFLNPTPYGGWSCPWLSLLDIGRDVDDIQPDLIWGLNFAIRRDALLDCGGFHVDLVPSRYSRWQGDGETGLAIKLAAKGYKIVYRNQSLLFHHCGPDRLNPDYFAKRGYYQGVCHSYAELRRKLRGVEIHESSNSQINRLKQGLRRSLSVIKNILASSPSSSALVSPWAAAAQDIHAKCQGAELEGYVFHQREVAADRALREWICRENYFNVDLRELHND